MEFCHFLKRGVGGGRGNQKSHNRRDPENVYAILDDVPLEFGGGISDVIAELPPLISYNENLVLPHVKKLHLFYQHRQIRKLKIVSI